MTAGARREDRDRCLAAGMDGYLAKPVSREILLAMVTRLGRTTDAAAPDPDDGVPDEIGFDQDLFDDLGMLATGGRDLRTELVEQFTHDTDALLIELREALVAGEATAVIRIAHAINGSAGQMGGRHLSASSARLERLARANQLSDGADDMREIDTDYQELRLVLTYYLSRMPPPRKALLV